MKFEPCCFLEIARRSGVEITPLNNGKIRVSAQDPQKFALFKQAAKAHKRKLLRYFREQAAHHQQADLFH